MLFNWCVLFEVRCFGGRSVKPYCQIGSVVSWIYSVSRRSWAVGVFCHKTVGI